MILAQELTGPPEEVFGGEEKRPQRKLTEEKGIYVA